MEIRSLEKELRVKAPAKMPLAAEAAYRAFAPDKGSREPDAPWVGGCQGNERKRA